MLDAVPAVVQHSQGVDSGQQDANLGRGKITVLLLNVVHSFATGFCILSSRQGMEALLLSPPKTEIRIVESLHLLHGH